MTDMRATIAARLRLVEGMHVPENRECEGGCGVIGIIGSKPLAGSLIIRPCAQMRNRGNGKGGGVAAVGLFPDRARHYAIHVAFLDEDARPAVERDYLTGNFEIDHAERQPSVDDHRAVGLEIKPPAVWRYFARVKKSVLERFIAENGFVDEDAAEDEFVFQNSFKLNVEHYVKPSPPRAFVLSHGRNLMILKAVGYAEDIARYYCLEDVKAHVWIGHQRYPTRGRVWHPGGAHPFVGLHEALVHNGDFANYHSVAEYLRQRGGVPLFVTDTEVSVLLFDLYTRVLGYPLEYVIEALGPTPEGDFERLSKRRQRIYRTIQTAHIHGSPDGPWFFIIARAEPKTGAPQLIGITDVSMLRPQVFAIQRGPHSFGAIASEKQAIDAFFEELALLDPSVPAAADQCWNARGGSCTDGGAFVYTLVKDGRRLVVDVRDKFGNAVSKDAKRQKVVNAPTPHRRRDDDLPSPTPREEDGAQHLVDLLRAEKRNEFLKASIELVTAAGPEGWKGPLEQLTSLRDRRWDCHGARPALVVASIDEAINGLIDRVPETPAALNCGDHRITHSAAKAGLLAAPPHGEAVLVVDARGFPPEGSGAVSRLIVEAYQQGWRRFIVYRLHGDRFIGCGLGSGSGDVRIDVYGSSGDYLGSGLDGATIVVHGNAQDQVGQILKAGRIVVYGDVGQTFLYGAKGGEALVRGSAAGRPLINAVGKIRAIINGTCLDYCAESFMAGEQLGGGFVIINGLAFDERGSVIGLELKYPGNNLFSLASGGACYLNDPYQTVSENQLNGAAFVPFTENDWNVILPYLQLNEELFGISIRFDLLVVDGVLKWPKEVFRKVVASTETKGLDWSSL